MTEMIERYIDTKKIKSIALEKNFDDVIMNEYIRFLSCHLQQDHDLGHFEEIEEESMLSYSNEYIDAFIEERKKGFSAVWSRYFIETLHGEPNLNAASAAYYFVEKQDHEQALKDLQLYANNTGRDQLFVKHFSYIIKNGGYNDSPSPEEQAIQYSELFRQQISEGKSELFADKYADLKSLGKYSELGCYAEAIEYENAIQSGLPKQIASIVAMEISDYIANQFHDYADAVTDEIVLSKRLKLTNEYLKISNK